MAATLADVAGPGAARPVVTREFRLGDVRHVFASAKRAEAQLGFRACEDFDAGMAEFATRAAASRLSHTTRALAKRRSWSPA